MNDVLYFCCSLEIIHQDHWSSRRMRGTQDGQGAMFSPTKKPTACGSGNGRMALPKERI